MAKEFPSKILMPFLATIALVAFSACGDKNATDPLTENIFGSPLSLEVKTFGELPDCNDIREGMEAYVVENSATYVCVNEKWVKEKSSSSSRSSSSVTPQSSDGETSVSSSSKGDGGSEAAMTSSSAKSSSSSVNSSSSVTPVSSSSETSESSSSVSIFNPKISYGELTDSRDGQTYRTVKIGNQVWMAENLNYESANSYCYGDSASSCSKFGRLYTWYAAVDACPSGWHLPRWAEWDSLLTTAVSNKAYAGVALKSSAVWNPLLVVGSYFDYVQTYDDTNISGFSALPAGGMDNGKYGGVGVVVDFWNASEFNDDETYVMRLYYSETYESWWRVSKQNAYSVRCLQGEKQSSLSSESPFNPNVEYGELTDSRDGRTYKTVKIGDQVWMAENLNFETASSHCFIDSTKFCEKYGRLYWWADAVGKTEEECGYGKTCSLPSGNIQGVCPDGWHLPSKTEFETLLTAVGGNSKTGSALKSAFGWYLGGTGTNESGFSALPGEYMFGSWGDPCFDDHEATVAGFWSSTEENQEVYNMSVGNNNDIAYLSTDDGDTKAFGFSVRCVKD